MPKVTKIMNDEIVSFYDEAAIGLFSLVISDPSNRIQSVISLSFDEVDKLYKAIKEYREAKWLSDSMPNQPEQMDLPK